MSCAAKGSFRKLNAPGGRNKRKKQLLKSNVKEQKRKQQGMLAESLGALSLLIPLTIVMTSLLIESSQSFEIARHLNRGANAAARALSQEYRTNPLITFDAVRQQQIFQNIRISNVIASNEQFSIPAGGWQLKSKPPTVTVLVTYLSGKGSPALPTFPAYDPLKVLSGAKISSSATYRLQ